MQSINIVNNSKFDATITIDFGGGRIAQSNIGFVRNLLPTNQKNDVIAIGAKASELLQKITDQRVLLSDMPDDDPDKFVDPNRERYFWADAQGNPVEGTLNVPVYLVLRTRKYTIYYNQNDVWTLLTEAI